VPFILFACGIFGHLVDFLLYFSALTLLVGHQKSIRFVKIERWGVYVVICLERGADCLHMVQLMPLYPKTPSSLAASKS